MPSSSARTRKRARRAERIEAADLDDAPRTQHCHPVADCFDLAEDVRRQQHGLAAVACFTDARSKHLLHERVEPGCGLVEEQQVGAAANAAINKIFWRLPWL